MTFVMVLACSAFAFAQVEEMPEVLVTSSQSSEEIVHEVPFNGYSGRHQLPCIKAQTLTTQTSFYKYCELGGISYYNTTHYTVTVTFDNYAMRTAVGDCRTYRGTDSPEDAVLRMWI